MWAIVRAFFFRLDHHASVGSLFDEALRADSTEN
jgi:hypothetical protein